MTARVDTIVVGAGSAGAALAARLTEDPAHRVLLLEAGPHHADEALPAVIRQGRVMSFSGYDWGYRATVHDGRRIRFPRGRITGGSSAVGATVGLRGIPADYDAWAAAGNPSWSYDQVLPYFRRLENDFDHGSDAEYHGSGGPVPIRRWRPDELAPAQSAFVDACVRAGFPEVKDHNHPDSTGVGSIPSTRHDAEVRATTRTTYLAMARGRRNLTVLADTTVDRVLFDGDRAVGVLAARGGGSFEAIPARRVVVAAGAIASPAILLRSGIGPAEDLRGFGIDVRVDCPGVGANLVDHQRTGAFLVPKPGAVDLSGAFLQEVLRTTSPVSGEFNDVQYYMVNHFDLGHFPELHMLAGAPQILGVMMVAQRPGSRGRVRLTSADPAAVPTIDLNFLDDEREMDVLVHGVRTAWQLAHHPGILSLGQEFVLLREAMIDRDEMVRQYVKTSLDSAYHPTGTVRMGPVGHQDAVVGERGEVHGVEGLHVCDASIMPATVRANTNLTAVMIGERVADALRRA